MSLSEISDQVRQLLSSAGRSLSPGDPGTTLLSHVNVVLMVFNDKLHQLQNGRWVTIAPNTPAAGTSSARQLAQAAARLLQDQKPEHAAGRSGRTVNADRRSPFNVLLLLPPSEFLTTAVDLPGVAPAAMRAALELQAGNMLPGYEAPLSLAVHLAAEADSSNPASAWWIPTERIDTLFSAFADEEIFLAAVMPRPAICPPASESVLLEDRDEQQLTVCLANPHIGSRCVLISQCLQTHQADLADASFAAQWQTETETLRLAAEKTQNLHSAEDYLQAISAHNLALPPVGNAYAIFPGSALAARNQFDKGKRLWMAAAALAALLGLGAVPFLIQSFQLASLQSELARQQELAAPARADQALVRDFESRWGVLTEYPRQDVPAMLLALQQEISPSVLTSLELDAGFVSIEGESSDPQNLLQQLEQNSMFTEVDFARATNNNRYYIDLRLTTVNFPAYQDWYFPEAN